MVIALDAMGGDFAPASAINGAILASEKLGTKNVTILLVGDTAIIEKHLAESGQQLPASVQIVHASEVIEMGEHPAKALQQKPNSSIAVGFGLLVKGKAQAFCSAGNTGAMLVGAMFSVKPLPGLIRPAIVGFVPRPSGKTGVILDVGANADVKPEVLAQFGEMGSLYAQYVLNIENPIVGLMNIGEEEGKGNALVQAAYQLLKTNEKITFHGNMEGRDLFTDLVDVVVCDGFTGNIILKLSESIHDIMQEHKIATDEFFDQLNYELHGGSPIIGVNGNVIIGHGLSSPLAITNMLKQCERMIASDINTKLKNALLETSLEKKDE
jgi:glycerol-3-phosphate acyltransferase PlsX